MHKAWGEGMVSNVNEKNGSVELDIIFKSEGPKRLLAQFAPITRRRTHRGCKMLKACGKIT